MIDYIFASRDGWCRLDCGLVVPSFRLFIGRGFSPSHCEFFESSQSSAPDELEVLAQARLRSSKEAFLHSGAWAYATFVFGKLSDNNFRFSTSAFPVKRTLGTFGTFVFEFLPDTHGTSTVSEAPPFELLELVDTDSN